MTTAEHPNPSRAHAQVPIPAIDAPLPEARITREQLQAAQRIVEREVRALHARMADDAARAAAERPRAG